MSTPLAGKVVLVVAAAEEIAGFVAYLLRDEAAFITGAELAIDGGDTAS
jgi:NAD(P)-dependent dehydrogenase (short-subunit alcohol dehydrogenase family)